MTSEERQAGTMTGEFRRAVKSQPENLRSGREAFANALAEIDIAALNSGTIIFSGIGASGHALTPAVLALRAAGRRAFAISPAALSDARAGGFGEAFVLVSQSGASVETLQALANLDGAPVVAITAQADSPLAKAAWAWLPLGPLRDTWVATLSYTATLQALGMLCDALLGTSSGWREVPDLANGVLESTSASVERISGSFAAVSAIDAVGGGAAKASAGEAALLVREGLRLPAVGMETREYLHGPLEAVDDGFGCVVFGRERELELAVQLASFRASVALLTDQRGVAASGVNVIEIPHVPNLVAPILQILPVQLLIDQVAQFRGLEIGELRRHQHDTKVL